MARVIDWRKIEPNVRRQVALGEAHRFRVWQAFRQLGKKASTKNVMMFTGLSASTVALHSRDLGRHLAGEDRDYNPDSQLRDVLTLMEGL